MVHALRIQGGKPLKGSVRVSGAKNAITKLIVASLISDKRCTFFNVPDIGDVAITLDMCKEIGMQVVWDKQSKILQVQTQVLKTAHVPYRFSASNRIPILMIGALLARSEQDIIVPTVTSDKTEARPVNYHLDALRELGATIELRQLKKDGAYYAFAPHGLKGCTITLPFPSVGATENSILAAATARGITTIKNAAIEPEVVELILFLQKLGAIITLDVDRTIRIQGTRSFHPVEHTLMSDRLEAASFALAAVATDGRILVEGAEHAHMVTFLNALREVGGNFSIREGGIEFFREGKLKGGIHIETDVHPGFMTDWQQPFSVLLTQATGASVIHETVYENRFGYTDTLTEMGADISSFRKCLGGKQCRFANHGSPHSIIIRGATELSGKAIHIPDLRAGFAYIMAALIAKGESIITGTEFLSRGYEGLAEKLRFLGADIEKQPLPKEHTTTDPDLFVHEFPDDKDDVALLSALHRLDI